MKPIWQREFLKGNDPPVRFGPVVLSQATGLTLVTEFAHQGRPTGTDPLRTDTTATDVFTAETESWTVRTSLTEAETQLSIFRAREQELSQGA